MSKKIQLHIPEPCHENWEKMSPVEKGKFCSSCQKQVIDFSRMSDREIAMFFKKPSTGSICGRFMTDQLARDLEIPRKRIPWVKYFFQFALPGFLFSCDARTKGHVVAKQKIEQAELKITMGEPKLEPQVQAYSDSFAVEVINEDATVGIIAMTPVESPDRFNETFLQNDSIKKLPVNDEKASPTIDSLQEIKGIVLDELEIPIPRASIIIKGTKTGAVCNSNGIFHFNTSANGPITVVASAVGYESKELEINSFLFPDSNIIQLKLSQTALGEVSVTAYNNLTRKGKIVCQRVDQSKSTVLPGLRPSAVSSFKLYPNPIQSNSTLHIQWNENQFGHFYLQLFNAAGQSVFNKEVWIDVESKLLSLDLPALETGNYFIKLTNKDTGKFFTSKLVIKQ